MASNSVDYIIRLVADDSELKKKLSSGELLNKAEMGKVKKLLTSVIDSANRDAKNLGKSLQDGLNVDTTQLENTLKFIGGVFDELEKTGNPMKDWAKTGKGVYKSFDQMQTSVAVLAQNVSTVQTGLNTLTSSFESFKSAYQAFDPAQFVRVSDTVNKTIDATNNLTSAVDKTAKSSKGFTVVGEEIGKVAVETKYALEEMEKHLSSIKGVLDKGYSITFASDLAEQFYTIDEEVEAVDKKIKKLETTFQKMPSSDEKFNSTRIELVQQYAKQIELYRKLDLVDSKYIEKHSKDASLLKLNDIFPDDVISKSRNRITQLVDDAKLQLGEVSKAAKTTQDGINIPIKLPTQGQLVDTINEYIDGINRTKAIHGIKIDIDSINDSANVIADLNKRAYGKNEADPDVNTTELVQKTEQRFGAILGVIDDKQKAILKNTETWRQDMVKAMKIASNDLEFEFGWDRKVEGGAQLLKESIQSYFDMPGNELNIHINQKALAEEIQSAVNQGGITANIGGNTTIANAEEIISALASVMKGGKLPKVTPSESKPLIGNNVAEKQEEISAKKEAEGVTKSYVTQLDASSNGVKNFIAVLKDFVNILYGKRVSAGAKAIGELLTSEGIDLKSIRNGATDKQIASQLTNAFLEQDEMGYAKGSAIADIMRAAIKKNKINTGTKNGTAINKLPQAFIELFDSAGVINETIDEWERRSHGFDVTKYGIDAGRSLALLNRARYPFKPGKNRKLNVDGGMFDISNDFESVISNLQKERQEIINQLEKEKNALAQIKSNMPEGKKSKYEEDYLAAKQITQEATQKRKQAEEELKAAETKFKANRTPETMKEFDDANTRFAELKKQEQEAMHLETEALGAWQRAKQRIVNLTNSIAKKEQLLESFGAIDKIQEERTKLGDKPTDEAMAKFKAAGEEFYLKSKALFEYLNGKFKFKGSVAIDGKDELIPINKPQDILNNIPENAKITYVQVYGDHSNSVVGGGFVGSTPNRNANYRKANGQERRWINQGEKSKYFVAQKREKDILNEEISYKKFHPLDVDANVDITGEAEKLKIQQLDEVIKYKKTVLEQIDKDIVTIEAQISELTKKYNNISDKRKQDSQDAIVNQEKVVQKTIGKQHTLQTQLDAKEEELKQAISAQTRIQNELASISEIDVEREKNAIRAQIKELENWEPYLKENIRRIEPDYKLAKDTLQYADRRVNKYQDELAQAKASGDTNKIDVATASLEKAIAERTRAQAEFNSITQKLNEANNNLNSNLQQRDNLYGKLSNVSIDTVHTKKQSELNSAITRVQKLEAEKTQLLSQVEQVKKDLQLVTDELNKLKERTPYKTGKQLEQAQSQKSVLENRKKQVVKEISDKEQEQQSAIFLSKKLELQNQYNTLQERSLQLQLEINQANGSDNGLVAKKEELEKVNQELEATRIKIQDLGGFVQQNTLESSTSQKHEYALGAVNEYQEALDILYKQRTELQNNLAEYKEKERQVNKYGAGQFDVKTEIAKKKTSLRTEFTKSDYFKSQLEVLAKERDEQLQKETKAFNDHIADLMKKEGLNPFDVSDYRKFIDSRTDLSDQLKAKENEIWTNYQNALAQKRKELLDAFEKSMDVKDGVVSAKFKVDNNGKWVNKTQKYDVKQDYLNELANKTKTAQGKLDALTPKIADIEQQKLLAMTYGGVAESEITHNARDLSVKLGQATQSVDSVTSGAQTLSDELQETAAKEDKHYNNYNPNQTYGSAEDFTQAFGGNITLNTSGLATEETLRAIHNLLGGDGGFVEEEETQSGNLARNKNPDELDISPAVPIAQEVEKKMLEVMGKALPIKNIQSIVGGVASQLFVESGDPTRSLDRDEFFEQNYKTIFEQSFAESQRQLNNEKAQTVETEKQVNMVKRLADTILMHERVNDSHLADGEKALQKSGYRIDPNPGVKEYRYDPWSTVKGTVENASLYVNRVFSKFIGDARKGDFSNIDTYLQYLNSAEQKLLELDKFFASIKNSKIKNKANVQNDLTSAKELSLQSIQLIREFMTDLSSPSTQKAVMDSMASHMPKFAHNISPRVAKEVTDIDTSSKIELGILQGKRVNIGNVASFFTDLRGHFADIESAALYFDRVGDVDSLKRVSEVLTYMGKAIAVFDRDYQKVPDSKDKKLYAFDRDQSVEDGKYLRELINGLLVKNGVDISATVKPEMKSGAVAKEVKENVAETPAEAPITPKTNQEDYKKAVETVRGAIGGFRGRSDAKRAELFNSLDRDVLDATNVLQARVKANEATKEEIALYNKMVQLREALNRVKQQEVVINSNNNVKPNQQNAVTSNESVIEDDDDLDPQMLAKLQEGVVGLLGKIDVLNQRIIQLEGTDTPEAQNEKAILQQELNETQSQVENISTMMSQIKENTSRTEEKSTSMQTKQSVGGGGILGVMRTLARESTLKSVLTALSEIAKHNAMAGSGKPNSALGLLEQFRRMLELDAWEGRERVAYMDLATGSMSNTITGDDKEISISRLETLRNAYKYMDANAMVHTHANQEDPYFSPDDLKLFGSDLMQGITKQILLSKDNMTVLDMTEVKDIQGLLDALVQTEHNFEALAETAKKFGAQYVSKSFSDLQAHPQQFVKMLGIKGVESKLSETETRDSARKGVLAEDAKEAADMLQESTGRAIKKTVERVGVELETLTEKTDAKGNKTWTSQINNKFGKAMKATWNDVNAQNLDEQFGVGTKASVALNEYREKYLSLNRLVEQFNSASESEKSGLQKQINDLLPLFNKAEKELIDLIARKEQFLRNGESLGVLNQDSIGRGTLEGIATKEFFGDGLTPGQNIATAGTQATKNGRQLLVDVLNNGTISRYGIEVDEATGQVRKLMLAEGDLANAFQNVNKVMRQNEIIQANIAGLDITDESQLQHFLANAHSPELDAYNTALKEMQVYTADLWNVMKEGGPASSQELDYLMMLSERVLALGDSAQKTSLKFKNLWAQNPERVTALNINTRHSDGTIVDNRDQIVRDQMHNLARNQALASHQQYDFVSFDNDKLKYTLTDVYGNVQKVTMAWNELYQKVVITNDATVASLNPVVAKIEQYKQAIIDAKTSGYLSDDGDKDFVKAEQEIEALMRKVQDGTATFEELEAARKNALGIGEDISKTIKTNKKLYTGTTAINAVNRQQDKIVSTFGDDKFKESDVKIVKDYKDAYAKLMALYEGENGFKTKGTLYDPANQETLRQQAVVVQNLGRKLMSSITQADKLSQLVEQSGSYTDKKGNEHALGGTLENLTPDQVKNLEATMRGYAQAVYGAGLENVKINKTTQTLTGTLRTSKDTVSDVAIQYNAAEQALFAYNKQERQSLSGAAAFIQSIKSKMKSLLHYTIGMHSIYRVFGEIRKGIQYVREIDSALTELRKVTDETEKTYDRFLNTASKTAGRIGSTIKEVVSSTADFARLGYSLEEATMMAESAQILMNVSEFTDVSTATDSLISSIQAFKYTAEESMGVVDILNTIGKQICRGYIVIYNRADNEKRLKARDSSDRVKLIF